MPHGWTRLCVYCTTLHCISNKRGCNEIFRKTVILIAANDPIFFIGLFEIVSNC